MGMPSEQVRSGMENYAHAWASGYMGRLLNLCGESGCSFHSLCPSRDRGADSDSRTATSLCARQAATASNAQPPAASCLIHAAQCPHDPAFMLGGSRGSLVRRSVGHVPCETRAAFHLQVERRPPYTSPLSHPSVCPHRPSQPTSHVSLAPELETSVSAGPPHARECTDGDMSALERSLPSWLRDLPLALAHPPPSAAARARSHAIEAPEQRPVQARPRPHRHRSLLQLLPVCAEGPCVTTPNPPMWRGMRPAHGGRNHSEIECHKIASACMRARERFGRVLISPLTVSHPPTPTFPLLPHLSSCSRASS